LKRIRIGVVGIGFGQHVLVPAFRGDARCEIAGICATSRERASRVAGRLGIPAAYGGWEEMVAAPGIDAVAVAAPPFVQPGVVLEAVRRGKGVFCEKPMSVSPQDALAMTEAAEASGLPNMVDFEFPEIEAWRRAKALLEEGTAGELRHVAVTWNVETYANRTGAHSWKTDLASGGGALYSFVSHAFHYLEWFLGPVDRVFAHLFRAPGDTRTGDTLNVLALETHAGVPVSLSVSSHAFPGTGHRVEFFGNRGTVVLDNPTSDYANGFRVYLGTREASALREIFGETAEVAPPGDGRIGAVSRVARRFLDWMEGGLPASPRFRDGLRVQNLIEAAFRSHRGGRRVGTA
jgi:predicted dehydrogenase